MQLNVADVGASRGTPLVDVCWNSALMAAPDSL